MIAGGNRLYVQGRLLSSVALTPGGLDTFCLSRANRGRFKSINEELLKKDRDDNHEQRPGWRLVFSPAGSCAHHPVEKRNPYQRLPHLPLDFIQYKKIHVDRLGALILTLAIPRLQTVRQAPVFAAGY